MPAMQLLMRGYLIFEGAAEGKLGMSGHLSVSGQAGRLPLPKSLCELDKLRSMNAEICH